MSVSPASTTVNSAESSSTSSLQVNSSDSDNELTIEAQAKQATKKAITYIKEVWRGSQEYHDKCFILDIHGFDIAAGHPNQEAIHRLAMHSIPKHIVDEEHWDLLTHEDEQALTRFQAYWVFDSTSHEPTLLDRHDKRAIVKLQQAYNEALIDNYEEAMDALEQAYNKAIKARDEVRNNHEKVMSKLEQAYKSAKAENDEELMSALEVTYNASLEQHAQEIGELEQTCIDADLAPILGPT